MNRRRCAPLVLLLLVAATAAAQEPWYRGYGYGYNRVPPRFPEGRQLRRRRSASAAAMFTSDRREPSGSGWSTDYPDADVNFSIRFAELTKTRVGKQPTGDPNHLVVPLADDWLYNCPYIHMEDAGTLALHRRRKSSGCATICSRAGSSGSTIPGAAWALQQWEEQIGRVLPPSEYPIRDITPRSRHLPHDVRGHRAAADPVDLALAAERRRDLGARRGQRRCR